MTIGIEQFRTPRDLWLDRMLIQPLRGPASGYPINREKETEMKNSGFIDANELQQQITDGAALAILDVRGPDEFVGALGHIPGAVNIPVGDIASRLIEIKALGNKPVIIVCQDRQALCPGGGDFTERKSCRCACAARRHGALEPDWPGRSRVVLLTDEGGRR